MCNLGFGVPEALDGETLKSDPAQKPLATGLRMKAEALKSKRTILAKRPWLGNLGGLGFGDFGFEEIRVSGLGGLGF